MFSKMQKRIFNSVFYVVLVFVLLISAISFGVTAVNLSRSQRQRTEANADNAVKSVEAYVSAVMGFVEQTSLQTGIIDAVDGINISEASRLLDALCNYGVKIDGATLYGESGYMAYSFSMGAPPTFRDLLAIDDVAQFYYGDEQTYVSMRKSAIANIYNSFYYSPNRGVISVMHKVYGNDETLKGLLVADVLPDTIYSTKLDYTSFGVKCNAFLATDNLLSLDETFINYYNAGGSGLTKDSKYFVASAQTLYGYNVVLFAPQYKFVGRLFIMAGVLVGIDALLIVLGAVFARYVARSVIEPLDRLHNRMTNEA
ncbi:MAG: cache domain-containing protein [Clostridia bacterium]|nr:cache domain-containing protein [Clostridia bacterium]